MVNEDIFILQTCGPFLRSLRIPPMKHEDECGSDEDCGSKVRIVLKFVQISFVTHSGGELHSDPEGAGVHHLADNHDRGLQDRSDDLGWRHFIKILYFIRNSLHLQ